VLRTQSLLCDSPAFIHPLNEFCFWRFKMVQKLSRKIGTKKRGKAKKV
jgi:hypothetical protein